MSDDFAFASEDETQSAPKTVKRNPRHPMWKVAIIDDEPDVHDVTRLALKNFEFEETPIEFLHGYSAKQARELFTQHDDIAVVLLDVVMEDDHSGLEMVKFIREKCNNAHTRIVLRTGQPGQAPERDVITDYDINDYKEKTELTARKLYTLMYSCLRSWRDIIALDDSRRGLENVITASQQIFSEESIEVFAEGVIQQITSLLHANDDAIFGRVDGLVTHENKEGIRFVAGTGSFKGCATQRLEDELPTEWVSLLDKSRNSVESMHSENYYLAQLTGREGQRSVLLLSGIGPRNALERHVLELFCQNALIAFDNLLLRLEIEETQRELVYRLGEAVETRSRETGNHVKRVAEISRLLAVKAGLSPRQSEVIKLASPMHDLGKIGIPDSILNKPGKLDKMEWEVMKTHASIGKQMLDSSDREILRLGGLISLEHHEKWDGSGYPYGKTGTDISIEGRITAVADVYDALASDRCYKKAWPQDQVLDYFREQKGKHFDPDLVDLLFRHLEDIDSIRQKYRDDFMAVET